MLQLVWRIVGKEAGIQVLPVTVALGIWGLAHRAGEHLAAYVGV
jgi:hypothetical protein